MIHIFEIPDRSYLIGDFLTFTALQQRLSHVSGENVLYGSNSTWLDSTRHDSTRLDTTRLDTFDFVEPVEQVETSVSSETSRALPTWRTTNDLVQVNNLLNNK